MEITWYTHLLSTYFAFLYYALQQCGFVVLAVIGVITRYPIAPFNLYTAAINFTCGLILLSFPFWLKRQSSPKILTTVFLLALTMIGASSAFGNGGIAAPAAIVFVLIPVFGFLLNGRAGGLTGLANKIL